MKKPVVERMPDSAFFEDRQVTGAGQKRAWRAVNPAWFMLALCLAMLYVFTSNVETATPPQLEAVARSRLTTIIQVERVWSTGPFGSVTVNVTGINLYGAATTERFVFDRGGSEPGIHRVVMDDIQGMVLTTRWLSLGMAVLCVAGIGLTLRARSNKALRKG